MFTTKSLRKEESTLETDESTVYIDSFTSLIKRAVQHNIQLLRQKNRPGLVLKKASSSFRKEIRCMMHIFGDVENPRKDSAALVEKILRNQMNLLLKKAARVSSARNRTSITHEELVYLLRHKKDKLRRLLQHLSMRDANEFISKKNYHQISGVINGQGRRVKLCINFLNNLNRTEGFQNILSSLSVKDSLITKRMKMRYFQTLEMSDDQYIEYTKKLQVSFFPSGGTERFKKWLFQDNPTNFVPTELALEIISYLARETVAQIVESSREVQMNAYSPDFFYQRLNTDDFRMSHISELHHVEHMDIANSSVLSSENGMITDNVSTNCVNNFKDQSEERSSGSIFQNDSNSKLKNFTTNGNKDDEKEDDTPLEGHSSWVFDFKLSDARNSPIHPRSIREFMHHSGMCPKFLSAQVSRRKSKECVLCL